MSDVPTLLQRDLVTQITMREGRERFAPGAMVAGRYRIVALLGRGGMGEVYRADDIRLSQPVALKFLPSRLESSSEALDLFLAEIRVGRQVSHPNVCRLYDIGEHEGHHFITMEYVDGENLDSLLKQIGKLPPSKAVEIARDIAAGLAAAHALGIVHRDLKPSNVMIDSRGRARVTDFGLAALGADLESDGRILGTPAYMAPEQRSGETATTRSDVYALGLVLYECLTGHRYQDATLSDIPDLDPVVFRLLRRCLEPDPQLRPESAREVLLALPGGDPLAAAVAAGETPSPELVAAATVHGELPVRTAWLLLGSMAVSALLVSILSGTTMMHRRIEGIRAPDAQADRAAEIAASVGAPIVDRSWFYHWNPAQVRWLRRVAGAHPDWAALLNARPAPLYFTWRSSPRPMHAFRWPAYVQSADPPLDVAGMARVTLDHRGRLIELASVPPERTPATERAQPVVWQRYFELAELRPGDFRAIAPEWSPPVASDERHAWIGTMPDSGREVRVEAAARAGRPVWFALILPWRSAPGASGGLDAVGDAATGVVEIALPLVTAILAFVNLRRGRGDRRGALRLALVVLITFAAARLCRADHGADASGEAALIKRLLGEALVAAAIVGVAYLALEPYVRRFKPEALISWVRLLNGRFRDALVGRDLLIGVAAGSLGVLIWMLSLAAQPWIGLREAAPMSINVSAMGGLDHLAYFLLHFVSFSMMDGITLAVLLVVITAVVRSPRAANAILYLAVMAIIFRVPGDLPQLRIAYAAVLAALVLLVFRHAGVLGVTAMSFVAGLYTVLPLTLDPDAFYFARATVVLLLPFGVAACAFVAALGGRPAFGDS